MIGLIISVFFIFIFLAIYIVEYLYNRFILKSIKAKIGKVSLSVKSGDLFEEEGLKVIPVNEYFDTQVDNNIISETTLHGIFVKRYIENNDKKLKKLNMEISKQLKNYDKYLEQIIFSLKTSSITAGETEKKLSECSLAKLKNIVSTINNK